MEGQAETNNVKIVVFSQKVHKKVPKIVLETFLAEHFLNRSGGAWVRSTIEGGCNVDVTRQNPEPLVRMRFFILTKGYVIQADILSIQKV